MIPKNVYRTPSTSDNLSMPLCVNMLQFIGLKLLESEVQKLMKICRPESTPTGDLHYQ